MPNEHIREAGEILQGLKNLVAAKLKPYTVFRCILCDYTRQDKDDVIMHTLTNHSLKEIFEKFRSGKYFKNVD